MTAGAFIDRPARVATPDRFLVLWQSEQSRGYHRVGELTRDHEGYRFRYLPQARSTEGFRAFASLPDFDREYRSAHLFAMFANRVMTPRRESYDAYVRSLGLDGPRPEPFEVLARTLGTRATDPVQLLPVPQVDEQGVLSFYFLVHGSRYVDADASQLAAVSSGDELYLAPEDDNDVSAVAVLVGREPRPTRTRALGYVPDALAPLVREVLASQAPVHVAAEHVNQPATGRVFDHMRLLVRFDALVPEGVDVDAALPD